MNEVIYRVIAAVVSAFLLCFSTAKMLGAMQQSGYKCGGFLRWLTRKDNLYYNRLAVFALCLALASAIVSLCFSFLGTRGGLLCAAVPFFGLCFVFQWVDSKYTLKVPHVKTGRFNRLFCGYLILVAGVGYGLLELLALLSDLNGFAVYESLAYVPFAVMPALLPFLLCAVNLIFSVFENARNRRFIKRAGQVLNETDIIRVGVVGSYGKTSVKNILKTLLSEKYSVVETPESFNTPMGVARTVFSPEFQGKQVFIAEMGARKSSDIAELCALVNPDYGVFTGICEQHIASFGSLDNVWLAKREILKCGAKTVVCGENLRERVEADFAGSIEETIVFADGETVKNVRLGATKTQFTVSVGGRETEAEISLLGNAAAENVRLAVTLCAKMGMTAEEIGKGLRKLQPVPHRLQLLEENGTFILDDAYNCNPVGAKEAIAALARFDGRKIIVTPGIVECGIIEERINGELGAQIAQADIDKVILVGDTLVGAVKNGYTQAGGDAERLICVKDLGKAKDVLSEYLAAGDAVLFLNDLPDVY